MGIRQILSLILSAALLINSTAFAADKVFYYHTDPAGTPLAMTDSSGNVVWRADNRPFGEEQSASGSMPNDRTFVGKEKDKESGLHYFGARYMKDDIGRFLSVDPVGAVDARTNKVNEKLLLNPQRLNPYAYSLNNPYRYVDKNGLWPEQVHNAIIDAAFPSDKFAQHRAIFKQASADVDKDQSTVNSFKHGMLAPGQGQEKAAELMAVFINEKVREYRHTGSLYALGEAMHALMDSTSPSHEGFQEWKGIMATPLYELGIHVMKETEGQFKSTPQYLNKSVDLLRQLYDTAAK